MIDLKMTWYEPGEKVFIKESGILFMARSVDDIFADYPKIEIRPIYALADNGKTEGEINLLISGNFDPNPPLLPKNDGSNPVRQHVKGDAEEGTQRYVYQFIGPKTGLPFRAGLTVHAARGTWSSLPHEFEAKAILESKPMDFWERFAYITNPRGKGGYQVRIGHLNSGMSNSFVMVNDVLPIGDRDIVNIPLGSHPATGAPGVQLAYLWCYTAADLSLMEKFGDE